jgi:MYXO-CTERM domain-containing protein
MIRKFVVSAALAACAATPALALTNPGFEASLGTNPTGWTTVPSGTPTTGSLASVVSGTPATVIDDGYGIYPNYTPNDPVTGGISAMAGNNFGLLDTCAPNTLSAACQLSAVYSFNLGGPVSTYGDIMWIRLLTQDWEVQYDDYVSVSYFGASSTTALATDTISASTMSVVDSGWQGFGVPVGTQSLQISLVNVGDAYNRPIAALDYQFATPVPEADTSAMMLAGLAALGLVARRRKTK